jgi:hypothetical protein
VADRVEEAAERLYGLPLDEFVRERDATAKALRAEKERDAAKAVAGLGKPSAGAWAINTVARERPDLRDELLAAGDAVRDAQDEAVAGHGAGALREATARQRQAIDAVIAAAAELAPGGRKLSRTILDRLRGTLQAAAGDDAVRDAIARARLVKEAESGGAWPFGGDEAPEPAPARASRKPREKPAPDDDREERAAREREARERRKELEAALAEARAERRARDRELARSERHAERATKRLEEAQAALDDAREEAEEATAELRAARDAADEARDHAARIEEQLD